MHAGEVTAGFVGQIKKELIYSGDTMNTTARIRSMCNDLNESFILSEDFMSDFDPPHGYQIDKIGTMELKGKDRTNKIVFFKIRLMGEAEITSITLITIHSHIITYGNAAD